MTTGGTPTPQDPIFPEHQPVDEVKKSNTRRGAVGIAIAIIILIVIAGIWALLGL